MPAQAETQRPVTVTRKLCSSPFHQGPRWLLACYFGRLNRAVTGLHPYCKTCVKIRQRKENMSEFEASNRAQYSREYKAIKRRDRGVPVRRLKNPSPRYGAGRTVNGSRSYELDASLVWQWLEPLVEKRSTANGDAWFMNRKRMNLDDTRVVRALRAGERKRFSIELADEWAVRYKLDFHLLVEFASAKGVR